MYTKDDRFVPSKVGHAHRQVDIADLNLAGTFDYLYAILHGYSRFMAF